MNEVTNGAQFWKQKENLLTEEPKAEDNGQTGPFIIPNNGRVIGDTNTPVESPVGDGDAARLTWTILRYLSILV
jgi:hypothetical protein